MSCVDQTVKAGEGESNVWYWLAAEATQGGETVVSEASALGRGGCERCGCTSLGACGRSLKHFPG